MLHRISEHAFYSPADAEVDQPCLYAVVGEERALMIDGGISPERAKAFADELKERTGRGVDFVLTTHWHWDHTFGLGGVDAPMLSHRNTAAHLKRLAGYASWSDGALDERIRSGEEINGCAENIRKVYPGAARDSIRIRQPDVVFGGAMELRLGGLACDIALLPPVHTDDSVSVFVREEKILFVGDAIWGNSYVHPPRYSAPAVLALMAFIRESGARIMAESHGEPMPADEFLASVSILEAAARGVLQGHADAPGLMEYLKRHVESGLPEDVDGTVELFVNGAKHI